MNSVAILFPSPPLPKFDSLPSFLTIQKYILWETQEHVVYEKGIQTTESGIDAPQFSEEELRAQILEELEKDQKAKQQAEDEERKRAEIEKIEEKRGNVTHFNVLFSA